VPADQVGLKILMGAELAVAVGASPQGSLMLSPVRRFQQLQLV
jgi:hypothetical protein